MDADPRPDLIVAIDFGMTCTGVAYANPSIGSDTVRWIQRWPGRMQANENKVPTILVYPSNQPQPTSWGFQCETLTEQNASDKEYREWFKTYLEVETLQKAQASVKDRSDLPASIEEVEKWCCDYFRYLYQYVQLKLQPELASRWEDARIEFIFSVPTTWRPYPTVERFRKVIERAGFGQFPSHKAIIGLTEAEAAAVHMARESPAIFQENDILLVCDVGGGTTDLSALRVAGTASDSLSLAQMDVVIGATIGSAQIDQSFESMALQRLQHADSGIPLGIGLEEAAWEMMKSKEYQNAKCDFGQPDDTPTFSIAVPRLARSYCNEPSGIVNGEMVFRRDSLQQLFDEQVNKLFQMIDVQLQRVQQKFPNEQVRHLVLSGGLGNSAFVQARLRQRYSPGANNLPNAAEVQVRVAPDPQLVVCKGIVADRLRKLKSGKSVLGWRCCRASYGTICKLPYNPQNAQHLGQPTIRDPVDGKLYICNVVDWFIKQGEPVSIDYPIVKAYRRKVTLRNDYRVFPTAVIVSYADKNQLPLVLDGNCSKMCDVISDFSLVDRTRFKLKNRHFWNFGEKYYRIDFCVKVALGPADICFELWFNGEKLSKDHSIRVEWHAASEPAVLPVTSPPQMPPSPQMLGPVPWPMPTNYPSQQLVELNGFNGMQQSPVY